MVSLVYQELKAGRERGVQEDMWGKLDHLVPQEQMAAQE